MNHKHIWMVVFDEKIKAICFTSHPESDLDGEMCNAELSLEEIESILNQHEGHDPIPASHPDVVEQ